MPDNKYALPNTTTILQFIKTISGCILFEFYIKPQLVGEETEQIRGCILFEFYIKPQLYALLFVVLLVVSYLSSTSNHNVSFAPRIRAEVVSYLSSTSNHNPPMPMVISLPLYLI